VEISISDSTGGDSDKAEDLYYSVKKDGLRQSKPRETFRKQEAQGRKDRIETSVAQLSKYLSLSAIGKEKKHLQSEIKTREVEDNKTASVVNALNQKN